MILQAAQAKAIDSAPSKGTVTLVGDDYTYSCGNSFLTGALSVLMNTEDPKYLYGTL